MGRILSKDLEKEWCCEYEASTSSTSGTSGARGIAGNDDGDNDDSSYDLNTANKNTSNTVSRQQHNRPHYESLHQNSRLILSGTNGKSRAEIAIWVNFLCALRLYQPQLLVLKDGNDVNTLY